MIQFYFLSVLLNALTGYILSSGSGQKESEGSLERGIDRFLRNDTFRLVLGLAAMATGLLKLLSSTNGDIPVIGDCIPAVAGLGTGFILVFEYYNARSALNTEKSEAFARSLEQNKRWVGFIALASAALHFLFPGVLFL
ncbi:MAG: hypothetical protein LBH70_00370 [Spirochaetaceae bacterium]|jgi:hypothetical protein|nr:hypothetical protein [Spirochaetaceae bacterium]